MFLTSTVLADILLVPNEYPTIASALNAANDGDHIHISAGTYVESNLFIEDPNIKIIGEVNSDGTPSVIIDGSKSTKGIILGIGIAGATGAEVQDIHFTGSSNGNALWIYHHEPIITNCLFTDNNADTQGAAVWGSDSEAVFQSCTFTSNHSSSGSVLFFKSTFDESGPTIRDCIFEDNSGDSAVQIQYCDPLFDQCTFKNNIGCGMANYSSNATLTSCTFENNSNLYEGGGMYNYESSPTLTNCRFENNTADYGGGMFNYGSSPTLTNCRFENNTADYGGGGMNNYYNSSPTLENCTFENNNANMIGGGAILNRTNSYGVFSNCYFVSNYGHQGGAVLNSPPMSPIVIYDNTKLRLLLGCVDYTAKNDLDSASGHHFLPYTPSDHQIYLLIISLHLKIDCVNVYGHLMYDNTKLRLLLGCVDYTAKNDLDSASGHHFLPIYTFRSSNL